MSLIIGLDEVGRGPLAGPLLVCALVLDSESLVNEPLINDSKKLTKKQRQTAFTLIKSQVKYIGLYWVNAAKLDELGMTKSLELAFAGALKNLDMSTEDIFKVERIVIDGNHNYLARAELPNELASKVETMIKADGQIRAVSAASIIAKVSRDKLMTTLDQKYPDYGFASNAGYGTKKHMEAIKQKGLAIKNIHRLSFEPLKSWLSLGEIKLC